MARAVGPYGVRPGVCPSCPFRSSISGAQLAVALRPVRREEIAASMLAGDSFPCHEEVYGQSAPGPAGSRQCAGGAVVLARMGKANRVMRAADWLGDPLPVDPGRVVVPWGTLDEWARLRAREV